MKEDLIYDNGKLRNCVFNKEKIGLIKTIIYFNNYKKVINGVDFEQLIESIKNVLVFVVWMVLFPMLPLIQGFFDYKRSVKDCRQHREGLKR